MSYRHRRASINVAGQFRATSASANKLLTKTEMASSKQKAPMDWDAVTECKKKPKLNKKSIYTEKFEGS